MKTIFIIISFLVSILNSYSQDKNITPGIWSLTLFEDSTKFNDTWEFKENGIYQELKGISDIDYSLIPDENGSWSILGDTLTIKITGEFTKGIPHQYSKITIWKFLTEPINSDLKLTMIEDSNKSSQVGTILRLKKKSF